MTLVDAKYYGKILRHARKSLKLNRRDTAQLLNINIHELRRYEHGCCALPENITTKLMVAGLAMLSVKKLNKPQKK